MIDINGLVLTADNTPNNSVEFTKLKQIATNTILGNGTAGSGSIEELIIGANLSVTAGVLNASGGGSLSDGDYVDILVSSGGTVFTISGSAVTQDKIAATGVGDGKVLTAAGSSMTWETPTGGVSSYRPNFLLGGM